MMGGEISFRKLRDTFLAIIFVSFVSGKGKYNRKNREESKDDKVVIKVNFLSSIF